MASSCSSTTDPALGGSMGPAINMASGGSICRLDWYAPAHPLETACPTRPQPEIQTTDIHMALGGNMGHLRTTNPHLGGITTMVGHRGRPIQKANHSSSWPLLLPRARAILQPVKCSRAVWVCVCLSSISPRSLPSSSASLHRASTAPLCRLSHLITHLFVKE